MFQLNPQENFLISRQLQWQADPATNYVRAVIKDIAGTTLETVNLTDEGDQYFAKSWRVPKDETGNGSYITIIISVYTDAGYTTLNENYATISDTYLIQQRVNSTFALGGGGADISYKKIEEIVRKVMAEMKDGSMEKMMEEHRKKINVAMLEMTKEIIKIGNSYPSLEPIISNLKAEITRLENRIESLPKFKETDYSSLSAGISKLESALADLKNENKENISNLKEEQGRETETIKEAIKNNIEFMKGIVEMYMDMVGNSNITMSLKDMKMPKNEKGERKSFMEIMDKLK